jgi:hypothetical protein
MVDRQLLARLDATRVSFCLVGDHALVVYGGAPRHADVELLTVDPDVLRPLFWEGHPAPVTELGDPLDHVAARLRWEGSPPHVLLVGLGHALVFAANTARFHDGLGVRVATPLGLVLTLLDLGGPGSRVDILELIRTQEARLGRPWRPPVQQHLAHMSRAARASWHQVELDLGAPT